MNETQQPIFDQKQLDELLHLIFAASKDRLATFEPEFDPVWQEQIRTYKRVVYDAYTQWNYRELFVALEVLLSALEKIEIAYLEWRKHWLETHVDTYMKEALDAVQTNTATPYMEPIDVDQGLGASIVMGNGSGSVGTDAWSSSLPYDMWREKIERIYTQHAVHRTMRGSGTFLEMVMIWSSMGIMLLYILRMITAGPVLRYVMLSVWALWLLSMFWKWMRYTV